MKSDPRKTETLAAILRRHGNQPVEATAATKPLLDPPDTLPFLRRDLCGSAVDAALQMTRVKRVVALYDVGRIVNRRTQPVHRWNRLRYSLALQEDTDVDWRYGRITNASLADYHVPVNADIPEIDVEALEIPD